VLWGQVAIPAQTEVETEAQPSGSRKGVQTTPSAPMRDCMRLRRLFERALNRAPVVQPLSSASSASEVRV